METVAARESDTDMGEADGGDALRRSWAPYRVRLEGQSVGLWISDLGFPIGFRPGMI